MANRSALSKLAWKHRKTAGGKAQCAFCGMSIYAGGVKGKDGFPYHKTCYESRVAGFTPGQMGLNPKFTIKKGLKFYKVTLGSGAIMIARTRTKSEAREWAIAQMREGQKTGRVHYIKSIDEATPEDREQYPVLFTGIGNPVRKCEMEHGCKGKVTHKILTKLGDFYVCSKHAKQAEGEKEVRYIVKLRNPGAAWHAEKARRNLEASWDKSYPKNIRNESLAIAGSEDIDAIASRHLGMSNPTKKFPWLPLAIVGGLVWWLAKRK